MDALKIFVFMALYQYVRYLVVAGGAYLYFWKLKKEWSLDRKLQTSEWTRSQIRREMKNSMVTSVIFSFFLSIPILEPFKSMTAVYTEPLEHGWLWLVLTVPFWKL